MTYLLGVFLFLGLKLVFGCAPSRWYCEVILLAVTVYQDIALHVQRELLLKFRW